MIIGAQMIENRTADTQLGKALEDRHRAFDVTLNRGHEANRAATDEVIDLGEVWNAARDAACFAENQPLQVRASTLNGARPFLGIHL